MFFMKPKGIKYVDRGDPAEHDFAIGDFLYDDTWHDLDLSGIISRGTKLVLLRVDMLAATDDLWLWLRKKGNTNTINMCVCQPGIANKTIHYDVHVVVDADGFAEYMVPYIQTQVLNVTVRGWFV